MVKSFAYLALDFALIAAIGYAGTFIPSVAVHAPLLATLVLWPVYWYAQGSVMTGVWVLAHECGHQSFSESQFVNDLVGTVCHSALLVPYHGAHEYLSTGTCAFSRRSLRIFP